MNKFLSQNIVNITSKVFDKFDSKNKIDVWKVDTKNYKSKVKKLVGMLSSDEINRVKNYYLDKDKTNFIVSRSILRTILSSYLQVQAQDIVFDYTPTLKPTLVLRHNNTIGFNVTHSKNLILYAIRHGGDIGIDVQYNQDISGFEKIAKRFYSPAENAQINLLPMEKQLSEFAKIWTTKEAFLKATSTGIIGFDNPNKIVRTMKSWNIRSFCPKVGYIASIVYK